MPLLDDISSDLDWREAEIASMRLLLQRADLSEKQTQTLLRAAWALLYAHYEGFCKNCLTLFFSEVSNLGVPCGRLPSSTRLFALQESIKAVCALPNPEFLAEVTDFTLKYGDAKADFPDIDTGSNLWPHVLLELLSHADLNPQMVMTHEQKLRTLVARRNSIAHGDNSFIADFNYYHGFESAVYDVIYDLALQVDQRLKLPPYQASSE